jgi:DNA invertase Pin-like site-specific DNA recombinase
MSHVFGYLRVNQADLEHDCPKCRTAYKQEDRFKDPVCPECGHVKPSAWNSIKAQCERLRELVNSKRFLESITGPAPDYFQTISEAADNRLPFFERPGAKRLWKMIKPGDHLAVETMRVGWRDPGDFVYSASRLIRVGVTIHLIRDELVLEPPLTRSDLLFQLSRMDRRPVDSERRRAKARARARKKPVNRHAGYGFAWAWDRQGQAYRVTQEGEQELMKQLVVWRRSHVDWPEILKRAQEQFPKSKFGRPYSLTTLRRLHAAGKADLRRFDAPRT